MVLLNQKFESKNKYDQHKKKKIKKNIDTKTKITVLYK